MATGGDYLFISCSGGSSVRIHIDTLQVQSVPCASTYGVVADPGGRVAYLGGYFSGAGVYKIDYDAPNPQCQFISTPQQVTAITLDYDGFLWASGYGNGNLMKINPSTGLTLLSQFTGTQPHGVSVDFNNRIWSVVHNAPFIQVHDVTTGAIISNTLPFTPTLTAQPGHNYDVYLYSDFTGAQIDRQAPFTRVGSWSAVHDGAIPGTPWTSVFWNAELPSPLKPETKVVVAARAADSQDLLGQSAFTPVLNNVPVSGLQGRFVEVKVDLAGPGYETPVLTDLTVAGPCGSTPGVACCLSDADCAPPDECSAGVCPAPGAACVFNKKPDCCLSDLDCDDNNPCTTGSCPLAGGPCDQVKAADCCVINKDCDDGQACTVDICSGPGGVCSSKAISGCCYEDKDCETGNKCLTATCPEPGKLCELKPVPGCCNVDSDCNDSNACTLDACDVATSTCKVPEKVEGCCLSDGDCDDGNDCTTDVCSGPGGQCKHAEIAECCVPGGPGEGDACEPPKSPNDQPPCQAGKKKCNAETNKFECEGAVKPSPETCDGVDNDCDGEVDKGEGLCSAGKACVKGQCASACKQGEFPCPGGQVCENGYCIVPGGVGTGGNGGEGGSAGASGSSAGGTSAGGSSGASAGGASGASVGGASGASAGGSSGASAGGSAGASAGGTSAGGSAAGGKAGSAGGGEPAPAGGGESKDEGGCGCQVPGAAHRSTTMVSGLLVLGLVASRRRRRDPRGIC
jgi:MYXO-CTERM domain-containing protein